MLSILRTMNKLGTSKNNIILEGKYDLEDPQDEIEKDSTENDEQNNNPDEDNEPTAEDNFGDGADEGDSVDDGGDYNDEDGETDSYSSDDNSYDSFGDGEPAEEERSAPEIKVLTLTTQEKNLANLRLMDDFSKLKRNVQNSIKTVSGLYSHSKEHNIIGEEVLLSLEDIVKDISVVVDYRLSDIYETNVKTYLGLLERYSMTMELYKKSYDTYMSTENGNY